MSTSDQIISYLFLRFVSFDEIINKQFNHVISSNSPFLHKLNKKSQKITKANKKLLIKKFKKETILTVCYNCKAYGPICE